VRGILAGAAVPVRQDEPGAMLVFPYVDNTGDNVTILEIANVSSRSLMLKGYMVTGEDCVRKNFFIRMTPNEPFLWNTSQPYSRRDAQGDLTQIQSFDGKLGFCFVWVLVEMNESPPLNPLTGKGLVFDDVRAFQYDAIPHQRVEVSKDAGGKNGQVAWAQLPLRFHAEGYSPEVRPGLAGKLAMCTFDIDAPGVNPPAIRVNVDVWNQHEVPQSRHGRLECFALLDLSADLGIDIDKVFTAKWHMIAYGDAPIWAVLMQSLDDMAWGHKVWYLPPPPNK
jgi:hypothetical protein